MEIKGLTSSEVEVIEKNVIQTIEHNSWAQIGEKNIGFDPSPISSSLYLTSRLVGVLYGFAEVIKVRNSSNIDKS